MSTAQSAVIKQSGKQARVTEGQRIKVDRLDGEKGDSITISDVMLVSSGGDTPTISIGNPVIKGASVVAKIVRHLRGPKVIVFKKKKRKGYTKKQGHRQDQTEILIESIKVA